MQTMTFERRDPAMQFDGAIHGAALAIAASAPLPPLVHLLETMRMSAIVVSHDARIAYVNQAGRIALDGEGGLALRDGQVIVTAPEARRKFALALHHACGLPFIDCGLMLRPARTGRPAQPVRIVALRRFSGQASGDGFGLALVCIGATHAQAPETALLQQIFGLTGAEAALMSAVAGGARLHECASRRGVSLATVRAQLRNVFVKTGASTQAELTTIAWSIPGLWIA